MSTMNGVEEMSLKCVLVGDSAVGKTALLVRFTSETFPDSYKPTVFENTGVEVYMDGVQISLGLWDTAGNDNFKQIRPRSYQQADVVLICYSVANPNSLANVQHKWIAEVRENLPKVPVLVVATQTDLREVGAHRGSCISAADGRSVAHDIHAKGYLECSSLSNRGVQQVFEHAVRAAVNQDQETEQATDVQLKSVQGLLTFDLDLVGHLNLHEMTFLIMRLSVLFKFSEGL